MISKFRIQNFRSIVDLTLDFGYGEGKAPNGYKDLDTLPFLTAPNNERLVPCMAFFGANASGKSNIIKAFLMMQILVSGQRLKESFDNNTSIYNFTMDKQLEPFFDPNITNPQNNGTSFEIEFFHENIHVHYTITLTNEAILVEKLVVDGEDIFTIEGMKENFTTIQSETYPISKLKEIFHVEASDGRGHQIRSFLSCLGTRYKGLNTNLTKAYEYFADKIIFIQNTRDFPLETAVKTLSQTTNGDKQRALAIIVEIIRRLDIDIEDIQIIASAIYSFHKTISGEIIMCDFKKMESAGTIRLASLVGLLLCAIKTGQVIFVDEMDNSLHPFIVMELLKLFKEKHYNTKNAQLIFTTHATDILEDGIMRVSEIAFVRKNIKYGTMVERLVDFKQENGGVKRDVRNVTNFRKQYLQDYYSGIPYPAL